MTTHKIRPSALPLALACSFALACANESATPTGLVSPPVASLSRSGIEAKDRERSSKTSCTTRLTAVDSGVFGPAGGTLAFGTSRLIIPPGALRDTVTISATIPAGDANRVELRPHGLVFFKAAGLQLDVAGCAMDDEVAPNVVYLSETGEVLETIYAVYDPRWHTIAASIWHFSGYAIAF